MTESWPARERYGAGGQVHWEALGEDYGEHTVPVIVAGEERKEMKLKDALSLIKTETRPVYIKDWHLVRSATNASQPLSQRLPYTTPYLFSDDCRKRWRMIAPEDASLLRQFPERRTSELASTFDDMEQLYARGELGPFQEGKRGWPGWQSVRTRMYVVEQEMDDVTNALSDVRDMLQGKDGWESEFAALVQHVVQQDAGWAWEGFWRMRYGQRPEVLWLASSTHTLVMQVRAWTDD
ncbi:hypothetical protein MEQU1_000249 [Malassezia equina]|uniref:Uncharacterized protein n=1 Tax=Malassezia equina TaxID=1381935 RepID=A0AAF0IX84_9BASI|nr:hypothetical protein MEQU1_000249 [Malassezia equina]